jgi:hypothetical protein
VKNRTTGCHEKLRPPVTAARPAITSWDSDASRIGSGEWLRTTDRWVAAR